jgi:hypothetical protein
VYYIAHGVEPLLPFDLAEPTYMVPLQSAMSTTELIVLRAHQLQKRPEDLDTIRDCVIKAHFTSIHQFKKKYTNTICCGVYGVLLPSIALNCLPGCCTRMFNCSGILD